MTIVQTLKTMMMITGATIVPVIALSIAISWAWISYQKGLGDAVEPVVVEELIPEPNLSEAEEEANFRAMCEADPNCGL